MRQPRDTRRRELRWPREMGCQDFLTIERERERDGTINSNNNLEPRNTQDEITRTKERKGEHSKNIKESDTSEVESWKGLTWRRFDAVGRVSSTVECITMGGRGKISEVETLHVVVVRNITGKRWRRDDCVWRRVVE